jgi:hypothetical protein
MPTEDEASIDEMTVGTRPVGRLLQKRFDGLPRPRRRALTH